MTTRISNAAARAFNPAPFFAHLRASGYFGDKLEQSEVDGCNAVLSACQEASWPISWTAYGLATAYHETAHTMRPIKEYGGPAYLTRMYDVTGQNPERAQKMGNASPGDGVKYCGRGYVQLTWRTNYAKAEKALGQPLVSQPDLAMDPAIAAAIMVRGMAEGWFTGRKLSGYFPNAGPASFESFAEARRIINGTDKASEIAGYALEFQKALQAGGWQ